MSVCYCYCDCPGCHYRTPSKPLCDLCQVELIKSALYDWKHSYENGVDIDEYGFVNFKELRFRLISSDDNLQNLHPTNHLCFDCLEKFELKTIKCECSLCHNFYPSLTTSSDPQGKSCNGWIDSNCIQTQYDSVYGDDQIKFIKPVPEHVMKLRGTDHVICDNCIHQLIKDGFCQKPSNNFVEGYHTRTCKCKLCRMSLNQMIS